MKVWSIYNYFNEKVDIGNMQTYQLISILQSIANKDNTIFDISKITLKDNRK